MSQRRRIPTSELRSIRHECAAGFSVIELLVAAAITAVLAGLMLGLVGNVLNSWNRSHGTLTTEARARVALDQLARDLQGAIYRNDGGAWLVLTVQSAAPSGHGWATGAADRGTADPAATRSDLPASEQGRIENARFGNGASWLRLITSRPTATADATLPGGGPAKEPSAPVAIALQVVRKSPSTQADAETVRYALYRSEVAPSITFGAGYDLDGSPSYLPTLTLPAEADVIADNVVDFGLWLYGRDTNGGLLRFHPKAGLIYSAKSPATALASEDRFPEVADVMLRVLTPEGARQILLLENGKISGNWWTIVEANSKVFTRRVELHGGQL